MSSNATLLRSAANFRHGIVLPPQLVDIVPADIEGIFNAGVPQNAESFKSAAGGVGHNVETAELSAIAEALERYAANAYQLPVKKYTEIDKAQVIPLTEFALFSQEQKNEKNFPFGYLYEEEKQLYTNVFSLSDNQEKYVPAGLVSLTAQYSSVFSTSSGLAAGPSHYMALLRAIQEIIERDALMTTWLHSIPGRQIKLDARYEKVIAKKEGEIVCIDATPTYSPFPVAIIAGKLPLRGKPRISLGAACRGTWEEAVEKAYLEWNQGITFAGYYSGYNQSLSYKTYADVRTFEDHAVYYTVHPEKWDNVPLIKGEMRAKRKKTNLQKGSVFELLELGIHRLEKAGIRLYYRDLTTPDLKQIGIAVIRVLSPDLTAIFCHQQYPLLGGRTEDVYWRYPWARKYTLHYPNPLPHPLG